MIVQGPLALDWGRRKWGVLPRLENGELSGVNPPRVERVRRWVRQSIHVGGRPEWVFVKVHTHGLVKANAGMLLGAGMRGMHDLLAAEFNDGRAWRLHYVSCRETYNLIKAAEAGRCGEPVAMRNEGIDPPPCRRAPA